VAEQLQAEIIASHLTLDAIRLRLAAQAAPRHWRKPLSALAAKLEHGTPLEIALEQQPSIPGELDCLLSEALQVASPTALILAAVRNRQQVGRNWEKLLRFVTYPALLLGAALVVGAVFSYVIKRSADFSMIDQLGIPGGEVMLSFIEDQHQALLGLALIYVWLGGVLLTIAVVGPRWAWSAVLGGVVLIGRPLRWISLQELLQRYALFITQGLPSVPAAEATARSFRLSRQAMAAQALSQRLQAVCALGQALCQSTLSDGLTRPALQLLDMRGADTARAIAETSQLLERLTDQRCRALATTLPVVLLLLVGSIVWSSMCAYLLGFLPLVTMITSLA